MSYISIIDFAKTGKKMLDEEKYLGALAIALMIPSMCSRIEYHNNSDYYSLDTNNENHWYDKKCYVDWCKKYLSKESLIGKVLGDNYAELLYDMRCDIVHAGVNNVCADGKEIILSLQPYSSLIFFEKCRVISVPGICLDILDAFQRWISIDKKNSMQKTIVIDLRIDDDRKKLEEMYKEAREHKDIDNNNA